MPATRKAAESQRPGPQESGRPAAWRPTPAIRPTAAAACTRSPKARPAAVHQRDRDRIIHSGAFRRLQYKTQVFIFHEGDHYRTRLTHSLEVAQIARSISRSLGLNEDLAEALALAHDLGHTPFGHAGEDALNAAMAPFGGFDHNEQTFRDPDPPGAALRRLRRPEPDLGDAGRHGQAQRPPDRGGRGRGGAAGFDAPLQPLASTWS